MFFPCLSMYLRFDIDSIAKGVPKEFQEMLVHSNSRMRRSLLRHNPRPL